MEGILARVDSILRRVLVDEFALTATPCRLSGKWSTRITRGYEDDSAERRDLERLVDWRTDEWTGITVARPEVVALSFVARGDELRFGRCRKGWSDALELGFRLGPWNAHHQRPVSVGLSIERVMPGTCGGGTSAFAEVRWSPTDPRERTTPLFDEGQTFPCGRITPLFRVEDEPPALAAALFLDKADVRFVRLGLWKLEPRLATRLPPVLARLLTRGRKGRIDGALLLDSTTA